MLLNSYQGTKNTALLSSGDSIENSASGNASNLPNINGNALLIFTSYIFAYVYRKMFSSDGPATAISTPSLDQDHTLKLQK